MHVLKMKRKDTQNHQHCCPATMWTKMANNKEPVKAINDKARRRSDCSRTWSCTLQIAVEVEVEVEAALARPQLVESNEWDSIPLGFEWMWQRLAGKWRSAVAAAIFRLVLMEWTAIYWAQRGFQRFQGFSNIQNRSRAIN